MSVHQIIYTSCMRGIKGVNDGQQVFSYDANFKDSNSDDIKSLFSYQPPALETGVIMTEEIATTLPQSFIYRRLENGKCALALSTYLGRDYMGSTGRFGNHLSHVIVADEADITDYPCEFFGASLLRSRMEFEEVNNPNPPEFLPTPVLEKGYTVDVEAVLEFLSIEDRLEVYKNMLHAMLSFEKERKRVVILDSPENIVMWIAALEYALPLKTALSINFTTYEFDPSLSVSQICGVVKNGTRFTPDSKHLHFVFDFETNDYIEFEKDVEFYDFIDTAFSLSVESLQDFHSFMTEGYNYDKADIDIYSGYALYSLLSDGIEGTTKKRLDSALSFADRYAQSVEKVKIVKNLLSQYDVLISIDSEIFLIVMRYVLSMKTSLSSQEQEYIKNIIIDRTLREFLNTDMTEEMFSAFYRNTDTLCQQNHFSLSTELMQDANREKLFAAMQSGVRTWKIAFIIKVISTYVKDCNIPSRELTPDNPLGQTYYGIVIAVYSQSSHNGDFLVTCILNEFSSDATYLTNMALNVEGMLLDLSNGEREVAALWKYYCQTMSSYQKNNFSAAYKVLLQYERYEQIFMLFESQLQDTSDCIESQKVFNEHFNEIVLQSKVYASQYGIKVLTLYYEKLCKYDGKQTRNARIELFDLLVSNNVNIDYADELIEDLLRKIPYESPSKQNIRLLQNAFQYTYNLRREPVSGKLLLLWIGMITEGIAMCGQYKEKIGQLEVLTQSGKANLGKLTEKSLESYFNWILPKMCKICQTNEEMSRFYGLFDMSTFVEREFFDECTKLYLRQCKDDKDYGVFAEYFGFTCVHSNTHIKEDTGKALCKLSKNKLAELDEVIREAFSKDKHFIQYWEDVKETAESTNPLLNNISNLFRRRKKED